jgi:Ca2+-binding EF-hand superfamily protein
MAADALFELLDERKFQMVDVFRALDKDGDGMVELRELHETLATMGVNADKAQTRKFFQVLDIDGDGVCSIAEFYDRMRVVQLERLLEQKVEQRRKAVEERKVRSMRSQERMQDTKARVAAFDDMGTVDNRSAGADAALVKIIMFMQTNRLKMTDLFSLMDVDDDGFIDADEVHGALTKLGSAVSRAEAMELCASMDVDGDGTVERAEFFKRYKELSREQRSSAWTRRRLAGMHRFRSLGPDYRAGTLDARAGKSGVWQAARYAVRPAAVPAPEHERKDPAPTALKIRPASAAPRLQSPKRGTRPGSAVPSRPGSAVPSRPGSAVPSRPGSRRDTTPQLKRRQDYADALLELLDTYKLKLADLFGQIDGERTTCATLRCTARRFDRCVFCGLPQRTIRVQLTMLSCARC